MLYFLSASVPNWTVPYNGPDTVLDVISMDILWDSLSISFKSMGSTGIVIFGICSSVVLIATLLKAVFQRNIKFQNAVDKKQFNRAVDEEDIYQNFDSIVDSKLTSNAVSRIVKRLDMERNMGEIIDDSINSRKWQHIVNNAVRLECRQMDVDDVAYHMGVQADAKAQYDSAEEALRKMKIRPRVSSGDYMRNVRLPEHGVNNDLNSSYYKERYRDSGHVRFPRGRKFLGDGYNHVWDN